MKVFQSQVMKYYFVNTSWAMSDDSARAKKKNDDENLRSRRYLIVTQYLHVGNTNGNKGTRET